MCTSRPSSSRSNRHIAALAAATLSVLATGCSTVLPYKAPTSGPVAKVRFIGAAAGYSISYLFIGNPSGTCRGEPTTDFGVMGGTFPGLNGTDYTPLGMKSADVFPRKTSYERAIPAGRPYLITSWVAANMKVCNSSFVFVPEPDGEYQVALTFDQSHCRPLITKLEQGPDGEVRANIHKDARSIECPR